MLIPVDESGAEGEGKAWELDLGLFGEVEGEARCVKGGT
jgi:hypothetical protein